MRHALGQKLAGVAAWKWLIGVGGAILLYRHYAGGGATTTTTTTGTPSTDYTGGYSPPLYVTPGSDTTTQPLQPAAPAPATGGGTGTQPGGPIDKLKPPKKRTRATHQPTHKAKPHKQKPAAGSHRNATPARKRTGHTKAAPPRARSSSSGHPAAHHKQAPAKPAAAHKAKPPRKTAPKPKPKAGGGGGRAVAS